MVRDTPATCIVPIPKNAPAASSPHDIRRRILRSASVTANNKDSKDDTQRQDSNRNRRRTRHREGLRDGSGSRGCECGDQLSLQFGRGRQRREGDAGGKALALKGDLTDQKDVDALIARTVETFGAVDVLVNNTGGLVARKTIAEMDLAHWNAVMDLNLTSAFLMIKACLPHMSAGSAIVNLASQAGRDGGGPGAVAYATSKGAMMTFTRGLAKELGPDIRVNAINPGMIDTDFHNIFTKDAVRANVANATPLKREGRPQEIGDLVVFLASDKSSFMTGTSIDINGGLLMS